MLDLDTFLPSPLWRRQREGKPRLLAPKTVRRVEAVEYYEAESLSRPFSISYS